MSTATILKIIEAREPGLVEHARELATPKEIDTSVVSQVFVHSMLIHRTEDNFRDYIIFVSSILKLYSPESLIAECKVRNGVCNVMAEKLDISQQMVSYYVKHARHYYSNLTAVKNAVERIVEKFGGLE